MSFYHYIFIIYRKNNLKLSLSSKKYPYISLSYIKLAISLFYCISCFYFRNIIYYSRLLKRIHTYTYLCHANFHTYFYYSPYPSFSFINTPHFQKVELPLEHITLQLRWSTDPEMWSDYENPPSAQTRSIFANQCLGQESPIRLIMVSIF